MTRFRRSALCSCSAVLLIVGCGGAGSPGGTPTASGTVAVDAYDNMFRPAEITIARGTDVVWTNKGRSRHDVDPVDGDAWGVTPDEFGPHATYVHRFTEPGTYEYYCTLHGTETKGMIGSVTVAK